MDICLELALEEVKALITAKLAYKSNTGIADFKRALIAWLETI